MLYEIHKYFIGEGYKNVFYHTQDYSNEPQQFTTWEGAFKELREYKKLIDDDIKDGHILNPVNLSKYKIVEVE